MNRDEALFYEALEHSAPAAAAAYLDRECAGDNELRERVERLLAAHGGPDSLLDQPANVAVATCDISPALSEHAGDRIGPYKLIQQIGEGGMGVVYMAQQTEPVKRLVALKIIKPGMDSRQVIARFEAERQALALMDHPNIARIFDAGVTGQSTESQASKPKQIQSSKFKAQNEEGSPVSDIPASDLELVCDLELGHCDFASARPYFVMELVKGIPITAYCDEKRLTPRERLELFVPVCHAVQHAHQKGIIHRDLKPSNVMIALYDGLPVPKVIDFGVAKATGGQLTDKTLVTNFGSLVGTLEYMSPEQAELNQLDVDTRSDIYALGVLLYELLTGSTPLDRQRLRATPFNEMLRIIREEEPETVSARLARTRRGVGVSPALSSRQTPSAVTSSSPAPSPQPLAPRFSELDWIVMKALEKDRSRRYETASSLAADIQRYLSDEPVLACPPTIMYRFQKFARKHKPALATAAAIALCLLLGTTVSAWQAVRATAAESQATANEAQAQASAQKAAEKAQEATTQRDEAQKQRDEVKALADKLAAKEQQLQRTLYAAHINLAHGAWNAGAIRRVNELLAQHRPKPGENDLRGFEWHYLYKLCHPELLTIKRNGGGLAFSPDGKRLALGDKTWDETKKAFGAAEVKVCDAQTGQELLRWKGHAGSLTYSPDGKRLASVGGDELKVWDAQTGKEILDLKGHTGGLECAAYSPDGKRLASGSSVWTLRDDKWVKVPSEVKIWDAMTGKELVGTKSHADSVYCIAFSPDGERLATGSHDGTVKVSNVQSGEELWSVKAHDYQVASVAFSPDGKRLLNGGAYGAKIRDAQTGRALVTLQGLTGQVNGAAYSPDGKRVATTSGFDPRVRVFDAHTGEEILSFKGHTGAGSSLAFNPEGTRLASASDDGTVRVWDVSTRQEPPTFSGSTGRMRSVGFNPDGKRVTGTSRDPMTSRTSIKVWESQSGREVVSIEEQAGESFLRVTVSPDGKRLAAGIGTRDGSKNNYVKVWDAQTGREHLTFKGHTAPVVSVAFSPDSTRVVSCSGQPNGIGNSDKGEPGEVKVWNAESGEELLTLNGHKRFVNDVAYSADGKRLATLSRDGTAKVWDAQTGQELLSMPVQATYMGSVAFSPDGKRLASSNKAPNTHSPAAAGEINLWDAQTGEELFTLQGHAGLVTSLAYSPDGKRLVSGTGGGAGGGQGREVKVWDAQTGEELLTFEKIGGGGVAFSPDGHRLVSAGAEGLKIFDATPQPNP